MRPLPLTDPDAFGSVEVSVQSGDVLVFTSDGIEEARDTEGEFYGREILKVSPAFDLRLNGDRHWST